MWRLVGLRTFKTGNVISNNSNSRIWAEDFIAVVFYLW